jgi:hypothetical protein
MPEGPAAFLIEGVLSARRRGHRPIRAKGGNRSISAPASVRPTTATSMSTLMLCAAGLGKRW